MRRQDECLGKYPTRLIREDEKTKCGDIKGSGPGEEQDGAMCHIKLDVCLLKAETSSSCAWVKLLITGNLHVWRRTSGQVGP